jgi:heme exporter protein B
MWRDALLVSGKDLRIEARSRVATMQVAPYALVMLLLFGLAFDQDRPLLQRAAPGLFWLAVLLCLLLAVQRSFAIEAGGGRDGLRLSGLDPAGIFAGKAAAIALQMLVLEALLGVGVVVVFGARVVDPALLVLAAAAATVGLAAAGTCYGMMAAGLRVRETLLPLLVLPVVAPVLLGATEAWTTAFGEHGAGGWRWLELLGGFDVVYLAAGVVFFGMLLEDG